MKRLVRWIAAGVLAGWCALVALVVIEVAARRSGSLATWAAPGSLLRMVVDLWNLLFMVSSWIASIVVWTRVGGAGFLRVISLGFLVLLGFFWSSLYVLFRAGSIRDDLDERGR